MGISRLESIIRNSINVDDTNSIEKISPCNNENNGCGIRQILLSELPYIPNNRNYSYRTVVIDTSEFIYKSIIGGDHSSGLLNFLEKMFRNNLFPIFVFDGKPPKEKTKTLEDRKRVKDRARDKVSHIKDKLDQVDKILLYVDKQKDDIKNSSINQISICDNIPAPQNQSPIKLTQVQNNINETIKELFSDSSDTSDEQGTDQDIFDLPCDDLIDKLRNKITDLMNESEKIKKKMVGIQDKQYSDIKKLFKLFNIPYIQAGVEAEMICAALVKHGIADYCIGNDMDLFALGCPRIIRNINFKNDIVDVYYFDDILANLGLTYTEFVDFCILLGSDYTSRMGGVKNYHILDFIRKYKSIENILENINEINQSLQYELSDDGIPRAIRIADQFAYQDARAIFHTNFEYEQIANLFHNPINSIYDICLQKCTELRQNTDEYGKVIKFCKEKCGRLNNMLVNKKINTIIWSNLFGDKTEQTEQFTIVRPKKTSPININSTKSEFNKISVYISSPILNRNEIIRDIKERGQKNISRIAFGSSPNHAKLMIT